jgi:C1A family cysteine protease
MGFMKINALARIVTGLALAFSVSQYAKASDQEYNDVNQRIQKFKHHWHARKNSISELPEQERKHRVQPLPAFMLEAIQNGTANSVQIPKSMVGAPSATMKGQVGPAPAMASVDWRNHNGDNFVTPIKDQGQCGSCWAFSTTAVLESQVMISQHLPLDLSEQVLISCGNAGSCASGGYLSKAADYIQKTGLPSENYDPYTASDSSCSNAGANWQNDTQKIKGYISLVKDVDTFESAITNFGPITVALTVYNDFYYYGGGVYKTDGQQLAGGHAVTLIGYDHANQYFIAKNSWGTGWGESGYFEIAYSEMNSKTNLGFQAYAFYTDSNAPSVNPTPVPTPKPTPVPTPKPTPVPTPKPTPVPTPTPTPVPTPKPTPVPTPVPSPTPSSSWTHCAQEGQQCKFSGTAQVRYGANGKYNIATFSGGVACTNAVFGDPIYGIVKSCDYQIVSNVAPTKKRSR